MKKLAVFLAFAVLGCVNQPKYDRPAVELPPAWKETAPRFAEDGRWWRIYQDAELEKVVDEALKGNADLLIAAARVDEARALLGEANSFFWPSIDAQAAVSRQQISTRTATSFPGIPREYSNHRATLNVSYELDLFGRLRAGSAAARHELEASEASREAVRLALAAQAAKSYFALRALDEQVALTRKTVSLREEALELQRKRLRGGVISEFELRQLEAETAVVRAQLPPLERERDREEVALAVLLGRTPRAVFQDGVAIKTAFEETPGAAVLPAGMPSELLLRRPDLVEAERALASANARVAQARAEMFPSISLTAFLGSESAALANLFAGGSAAAWQIAAGLTQPIFQGGRLAARRDAADARERAALVQYEQAIRSAFGEVRTALIAQARARESYDAESARARALAESHRLARLRYQNGVASQLDVIDAERGLLQAQIARIEALRAHRAAVADLFRALGG
ncbi:MAG TPA: efflux transporter outer membrane subunit [Burkholderiales bacterium]